MKKALILGAGIVGCTMAHLLKKNGWKCTVIEKEQYVGGGCRTFFCGGHPYTRGPRPYYGYSEKIFNWIDSFVKMRRFPFSLLSYVEQDQRFYSYPIHEDDIPRMKESKRIYQELKKTQSDKKPNDFQEYWISRVGPTLYRMFVDQYSKKMWLIDSNKELDTFAWSAKDNPINSGSKECYKGSIIGYPIDRFGYNSYFEKTLGANTLISGQAVSGIDLKKRSVVFSGGRKVRGDVLISSIPIEELCNYCLGELPYAGRDFIPFVLPCKQIFPDDIRFCHYTQGEPFTRIVEYKKLTFHKSQDSLLVMEIPSRSNKLYPYMIKKHLNKAKEYLQSLPEKVYSIGRLGTYKYSTIEQTLWQCFSLFKKLTGKSIDGIEKELYNIGDTSLLSSRKSKQKRL